MRKKNDEIYFQICNAQHCSCCQYQHQPALPLSTSRSTRRRPMTTCTPPLSSFSFFVIFSVIGCCKRNRWHGGGWAFGAAKDHIQGGWWRGWGIEGWSGRRETTCHWGSQIRCFGRDLGRLMWRQTWSGREEAWWRDWRGLWILGWINTTAIERES